MSRNTQEAWVETPRCPGSHTHRIRAGASILIHSSFRKNGGVIEGASNVDGPQKFLLVDDHAAFRQTVKDFLPGKPVEVIECDDGKEAVEAFSRQQPDWTLMDIQMPGMDGLRATRLICSENPKARVIILSQHDSPDLREAAHEAGAIAYIQKDRLKDLPGIIASFLHDCPPNENPDSIT